MDFVAKSLVSCELISLSMVGRVLPLDIFRTSLTFAFLFFVLIGSHSSFFFMHLIWTAVTWKESVRQCCHKSISRLKLMHIEKLLQLMPLIQFGLHKDLTGMSLLIWVYGLSDGGWSVDSGLQTEAIFVSSWILEPVYGERAKGGRILQNMMLLCRIVVSSGRIGAQSRDSRQLHAVVVLWRLFAILF